jgi:citrate-Mg2+:H+ or citrate-Ca2+:H+ symporter, CitMHS family
MAPQAREVWQCYVPAILLVTLAGVSLADPHKKVLWRAGLVSLSMLTIGVALGQIPL